MIARSGITLFFVSCFLLVACDSSQSPSGSYQPELAGKPAPSIAKEYTFSAVPEGSQMRVPEVYGPVVNYLNAHIEGAKLVLVAPKNHAEFESGLLNKQYDIALANAFQTVKAMAYGYQVIAKKGDDEQFYGIYPSQIKIWFRSIG